MQWENAGGRYLISSCQQNLHWNYYLSNCSTAAVTSSHKFVVLKKHSAIFVDCLAESWSKVAFWRSCTSVRHSVFFMGWSLHSAAIKYSPQNSGTTNRISSNRTQPTNANTVVAPTEQASLVGQVPNNHKSMVPSSNIATSMIVARIFATPSEWTVNCVIATALTCPTKTHAK